MKLRTAGAALVGAAVAAGAVLTATVLMAGPAGATTVSGQAKLSPNGASTTTDIQMTVNGSKTASTIDFDNQPLVELDFDTGNDGSVGISGTFTVFYTDNDGNVVNTVCVNVPMHGFSQGDCTIPDGTLPVGTWKIFAQYNGDNNNDASASPPVKLEVDQEPTGTSLSTVPTITYGKESDENFAVTPAPRTSGTPTGQFKVISLDGSTTFCQGPLSSSVGKCSLLDTRLPPGTYKFFGEYEGDSTYIASVSDVQTVTVTQADSTTALALKPSKIGFGQQQTEQMTVTVAPTTSGTPTGNVSINIGATNLCTVPVPDSGIVTCGLGVGQLPIGSYDVAASYSGDTNFSSSSQHQQLVVTGKSVATPSLTLSKTKVTFGQEQAEKLTANVAGQVPGVPATGKVTFKAGSVALCSFKLAAGQGGCKLGATKLSPGTYHVTASYSGDITYGKANSASQTLTVAAGPTTTALTLSKLKVQAGQEQKETLTVAVQPKVKSSATPGGKVTVKAGSTTICVITLKKAKGSCALTSKQLRPGTYHLTATYAGVSPFARSASAKKALTVTK